VEVPWGKCGASIKVTCPVPGKLTRKSVWGWTRRLWKKLAGIEAIYGTEHPQQDSP